MVFYKLGKRYCPLFLLFDFGHYSIFNIKHFSYLCSFYDIAIRYFFFYVTIPPPGQSCPIAASPHWSEQKGRSRLSVGSIYLPEFSSGQLQHSPSLHCSRFVGFFSAFHDKPNSPICVERLWVYCTWSGSMSVDEKNLKGFCTLIGNLH